MKGAQKCTGAHDSEGSSRSRSDGRGKLDARKENPAHGRRFGGVEARNRKKMEESKEERTYCGGPEKEENDWRSPSIRQTRLSP